MSRAALPVRRAFTLTESLIALVVLSAVAATAAQFGTWVLSERKRADARLDALDLAANVLEEARSRPWDRLTPEWAAGVHVPDALTDRLPSGELVVTVSANEAQPKLKSVTVEVHYANPGGLPARPVRLVALFARPRPEATP